ncbi:MAG: hypothetical protein Q8P18_20465 [Pseudomonadota bacterium]|nr:hypothetical protein [Pseudomonadota bacterium]
MDTSDSLTIALPVTLAGWSLLSLYVIFVGADREPYYCFSAADALEQVGLACSLLTLAPVWAGFLFWGVYRRQLALGWLALLVPLGIVTLYLQISPFGYVEDIARVHHDCPAPCGTRSR